MIDLLIQLIVVMLLGGLVYYLIMMLELPAPFNKIIQVAVILICILIVLSMFTGFLDFSHYHNRPLIH